MKNIIYLVLLLFFVGCENDRKFEKIEINKNDTKITDDKLINSVNRILKTGDPAFKIQQNIDSSFRKMDKTISSKKTNEDESI